MDQLLDLVDKSHVYDLSQPYFVGMPHFPTHPPFLFGLTKKHGDLVAPGEVSSSADSIALGGHVGTHIDALCHFSCGGKLHGGIETAGNQSYSTGLSVLSVATIAPILRRGVLLDIAGAQAVDALPVDFSITAAVLDAVLESQQISIHPGDVVLLRTGWARFFDDPAKYLTGGKGPQPAGPGPEISAARWLSQRKIFAAGSDTIAFEQVPSPAMPVHVHLLVESGIHIIEVLNLEQLADARVHQFLFVAAPLRILGGTGSPIRPLAITLNQPSDEHSV